MLFAKNDLEWVSLPYKAKLKTCAGAKSNGCLFERAGDCGMTKDKIKNVMIRNSTAEFLIFTNQAGENGIAVRGAFG